MLRGYGLAMAVPPPLLLWAAMSFLPRRVAAWLGAPRRRAGTTPGWCSSTGSRTAPASRCWRWSAPLPGCGRPRWFTGCAGGEGAERAVVSDIGSAAERSTAFGWYNMTLAGGRAGPPVLRWRVAGVRPGCRLQCSAALLAWWRRAAAGGGAAGGTAGAAGPDKR